jgi:hypothetical protein
MLKQIKRTLNMRIQWNRVTWYSKLIAVILFVAVLFLGMYIGIKIQQLKDMQNYPQQGQPANLGSKSS